jgi:Staygreen protein
MTRLNPKKLHVQFAAGVTPKGPLIPRRYTLTHSDSTGELFLTIAPEVDYKQISGWYTRLMRDEVLAEWQDSEDGPALHLFCHVSGGLAFGGASMRYDIFQRELPLVLEAIRFGDRGLFETQPELDQAPIWIRFQSTNRRYHKAERWGTPADYRP